jgi:peptidoglycan/xylan/chitin deacetylase (PgdA/CDA1 family)
MGALKIVYGALFMTIIAGCTGPTPQTEPEGFPPANKYIAFTFDDGPLTKIGQLLDTLRENNVKVTFFLIGQNVNRRPDDVRRIIAEGHEVGNHSNDHAYLGKNSALDENSIRRNINAVQEALHEITGAYPVYFRAPYLDYSPVLETVVREMGMAFIGTTIDSRDWDGGAITTNLIINNVLDSARDGGIILMHEHSSGDLERTIRAIPAIVSELRKRGYEIISIGELAKKKGVDYEAGKYYNSVN